MKTNPNEGGKTVLRDVEQHVDIRVVDSSTFSDVCKTNLTGYFPRELSFEVSPYELKLVFLLLSAVHDNVGITAADDGGQGSACT